jgi:hypothetical protein
MVKKKNVSCILYRVRLLGGPQAFNLIRRVRSPYAIPTCRRSSLGGQRIVYPTKEGSIPFGGARANRDLVGSSMFSQCLLVSMGDIETNAKTSLLRRIQARCRDLTVNQWLAEFDPRRRSKEVLYPCNSVD